MLQFNILHSHSIKHIQMFSQTTVYEALVYYETGTEYLEGIIL